MKFYPGPCADRVSMACVLEYVLRLRLLFRSLSLHPEQSPLSALWLASQRVIGVCLARKKIKAGFIFTVREYSSQASTIFEYLEYSSCALPRPRKAHDM